MRNIVVVGSIYMDMVVNTTRVPGFDTEVDGRGFATSCAGSALLAMAVAKLNGSASIIGAVGNDDIGTMLKTVLESKGVDTSGVTTVKLNSGVCMNTVCNGAAQIIRDIGANSKFAAEHIDKNIELIKQADIVIIQPDIPVASVMYAAQRAKEFGCRVILNPSPVAKLPDKLFEYIDTIICNEQEARHLTCSQDAYTAMGMFRRCGVNQVVVTLGSKGCIYYVYGDINKCPAFKTKVVDHTGAGAAFTAAYCSVSTDEHHENNSVEFASFAASITVSRKGCMEAIPTYNEIIEKMEN